MSDVGRQGKPTVVVAPVVVLAVVVVVVVAAGIKDVG